ncbi:2-isopropylmalate synthase [Colwellia sp. 4_MG-2023]|jgi:2-isopropylmalate synthase|uniref:2-isopropylmalate synthase n=1 Tax=unclassified Colwellia TaxID=196834 RepID=UPI001C0979B7|nr:MULTISPECIES: 2-isopropylmalate synthase [unclassified Colwellia]MBU2925408.1 2-isopropylmalate synthase [Colwellia sp. C2M11]MDO6506009.1 2-isopropylmalate synthase [Colwellia sp. 5_MG-2023]MDO6554931.1 2-isopropylmalate synthase [Colwellia sp. 4_MG-2023]MDO6653462.1 2-isopropylmalate synthase [Colwellia sp. 3_MG-2023]MDO6666280.1 2-isopropylmalate synthase [Colwellia sp. 2_MG-2023]
MSNITSTSPGSATNNSSSTDNVIIFDTTLRDGEQALNASLSVHEKLQIALSLERLGVDIMEVGFPVSSPGDFESVQQIARTIKNARVCGLARAVEADIDACAQSLKVAEQFRIHTFISTSDVHVQQKLKKEFADVQAMAVHAVKYARKFTDDVEFSCEDAGRTPIDNLCRMVEAAITAGATTVNIPDTVGYTLPFEFQGIITNLFNRVPNIDKAIISVHCHNDLGLAVANSMAAVQAGARQIECTINGIGERAGNCSLEEVAMIMQTRQALLGVHTNINHQEIARTSKLVSTVCNMPVQLNKAIVGGNAFSHSSGIHQDGMLKASNTYEIMTPESVGIAKTKLNLTSRSGRHVIKHRMESLGYKESDYEIEELYADFLALADKKGQVFDDDLEALVFKLQQKDLKDFFRLERINVQCGDGDFATASIKLISGEASVEGEANNSKVHAATGNGPVDALYQAIKQSVDIEFEVSDYTISNKGSGEDGLGQADLVITWQGRNFHGYGLETDVIEASGQALIHALNSIHRAITIADLKSAKK